ncbi:hypothetical protein HDU96_010143 [Phlyctochytrium bullatum]|nr:hypothetical protein HDU96_010143 [Phlyctochytrium bullatum]
MAPLPPLSPLRLLTPSPTPSPDPAPDSLAPLLIGISLSLLSSAMTSLGLTLQAQSLRASACRSCGTCIRCVDTPKTLSALWRRCRWHVGLVLYLLPQVFGSALALVFIPPILLAPLGAAGLVFNLWFSALLLRTEVTAKDGWGTVLIAVGGVVVSTFTAGIGEDEGKGTIDDLIRLFTSPHAIIYFTLQTLLILTLALTIALIHRAPTPTPSSLPTTTTPTPTRTPPRARPLPITPTESTPLLATSADSERTLAEASGVPTGDACTKASGRGCACDVCCASSEGEEGTGEEEMTGRRWGAPVAWAAERCRSAWASTERRTVVGMLYAAVGGMGASDSLTVARGGIEVLLLSFTEPSSTGQVVFSCVIIALLLITMVVQLYSLNKALAHASPLLAVPLFYTFFTVFALFNSLLGLNEAHLLSRPALLLTTLGVAVIVAGVWLLSSAQRQPTDSPVPTSSDPARNPAVDPSDPTDPVAVAAATDPAAPSTPHQHLSSYCSFENLCIEDDADGPTAPGGDGTHRRGGTTTRAKWAWEAGWAETPGVDTTPRPPVSTRRVLGPPPTPTTPPTASLPSLGDDDARGRAPPHATPELRKRPSILKAVASQPHLPRLEDAETPASEGAAPGLLWRLQAAWKTLVHAGGAAPRSASSSPVRAPYHHFRNGSLGGIGGGAGVAVGRVGKEEAGEDAGVTTEESPVVGTPGRGGGWRPASVAAKAARRWAAAAAGEFSALGMARSPVAGAAGPVAAVASPQDVQADPFSSSYVSFGAAAEEAAAAAAVAAAAGGVETPSLVGSPAREPTRATRPWFLLTELVKVSTSGAVVVGKREAGEGREDGAGEAEVGDAEAEWLLEAAEVVVASATVASA